ncbi:MAG: hypothetical protein MUO27_11350, partial [Sedimentisphaerales bacterium]|nr:hypothetical protein [Sedimentisphaerales bacterium]
MQSSATRRDLFKIASLGTIAAVSGRTFAQAESIKTTPPLRKTDYKLGLASYTTRKFDLDKTI